GGELRFGYVSNLWVQATLYVNGQSIRAQLYRADTGQYLNDHGVWQTLPAWAINITDSSITQAGVAGLFRGAGTAIPVYWDNFVESPVVADSVPPTISLTAPAAGASLTGATAVTPQVSDNVGVTRVEFYVDNVLYAATTSAPFTWTFDSST